MKIAGISPMPGVAAFDATALGEHVPGAARVHAARTRTGSVAAAQPRLRACR